MALIVTGNLLLCASTVSALLIKGLGQVKLRVCLMESLGTNRGLTG